MHLHDLGSQSHVPHCRAVHGPQGVHHNLWYYSVRYCAEMVEE